jgi:hypothetical protein
VKRAGQKCAGPNIRHNSVKPVKLGSEDDAAKGQVPTGTAVATPLERLR